MNLYAAVKVFCVRENIAIQAVASALNIRVSDLMSEAEK